MSQLKTNTCTGSTDPHAFSIVTEYQLPAPRLYCGAKCTENKDLSRRRHPREPLTSGQKRAFTAASLNQLSAVPFEQLFCCTVAAGAAALLGQRLGCVETRGSCVRQATEGGSVCHHVTVVTLRIMFLLFWVAKVSLSLAIYLVYSCCAHACWSGKVISRVNHKGLMETFM